MKNLVRCTAALAILGLAGPACADTWINTDVGLGPNPIERTTHEEYTLGANGQVDVQGIGGSVEVTAADGPKADFRYERKAATEQDFACETLHSEHTDSRLHIWVDRSRDRACKNIRASDKLILIVPRGAEVSLEEIGDSVKVSGVEGLVRLTSIGDSATLTGVQQLEAKAIGDSLTLDVSKLGPAGIRISSVGDSVKLSLPESLNARLRINSVGDEIRGPGMRLESPDTDYDAVLGKGGPTISINSVGDSVVIRDGPSLKKKKASEY